MEWSKEALMTNKQREEMAKNKDVIHAHHGQVLRKLLDSYKLDAVLNPEMNGPIFDRAIELADKAIAYYDELLPSKGFWGRVCSRQSNRIKELEKQVEELKEYKWKYEDLCK